MNVNPTYQQTNPATLLSVLGAHKREVNKDFNAVKIGVIQSFSPGDSTHGPSATVKIAQQQITSVAPDGTRTIQSYPLLATCPVYFPNGGGFTLTFPVAEGDECIILFNDRELDNWMINGPGQPPTTGRMHDLSDAIIIVGLRSNPRGLANISTNSTQLRSDDQTVFVDLNSNTATVFAPHVKVHAGISYSWDVNGYGQKVTWTGGENYTIDNYVTGAIVTTNTHPIDPPEAP